MLLAKPIQFRVRFIIYRKNPKLIRLVNYSGFSLNPHELQFVQLFDLIYLKMM